MGERAMVSNGASQWASRNQLQLIQRAKHKKAWVVERHKEVLRTAMHKTQTQLAAEGIVVKFSHVLQSTARTPYSPSEKAHPTLPFLVAFRLSYPRSSTLLVRLISTTRPGWKAHATFIDCGKSLLLPWSRLLLNVDSP